MPPKQTNLWGSGGVFAQHFPGYEPRRQQREMFTAVCKAISGDHHLIAEAGTGTGKSLAYLAPAIIAAHRNPQIRIAVSTATINLQEQLVNKDIPAVVSALVAGGLLPPGQFSWATLKGKSNYLCREQHLAFAQQHEDGPWHAAASLLDKIERWDTSTGDRAELSLRPEENWPWTLMSARSSNSCTLYRSGEHDCYLHQARQRAQNAHIVVTNHALLLSDLAAHSPYLGHITHVIIDEAHHLEEEASRQFGWELTEGELGRHLTQLERDPVLADASASMSNAWSKFWSAVTACDDGTDRRDEDAITITPKLRKTGDWADVVLAGQQLTTTAGGFATTLSLETARARNTGDTPRETILRPIANTLSETLERINALTEGHNDAVVQWIQPHRDRSSSVHTVPLQVGPILEEKLFDQKRSVILTSATLTTGPQNFSLLIEQTGFPGGDRLALPAPFDYSRQARFMSPSDMPNPRQYREFGDATVSVLTDLATRLEGHTLALFTSNAAIREAAKGMRHQLSESGISLMAQGSDGAPADIIARFRANPRAVILGTNSFWEGVDLAEDLLHAVAICRLPFPVPADPVIAARSRLFNNAFRDYHVPLAILRFRQGFGRLVRNHRSRGAVVVLDPRIRHPRYGLEFFNSLPVCDYAKANIDNVGKLARQWLDESQPDPNDLPTIGAGLPRK